MDSSGNLANCCAVAFHDLAMECCRYLVVQSTNKTAIMLFILPTKSNSKFDNNGTDSLVTCTLQLIPDAKTFYLKIQVQIMEHTRFTKRTEACTRWSDALQDALLMTIGTHYTQVTAFGLSSSAFESYEQLHKYQNLAQNKLTLPFLT